MDISTLIPQFGGFIWMILAFVVALSVIVAVHEYGHYIVGRWSGIHAETFSLGFGPVLWSRVDKRGTRWQIAALPFGGFVKFLGDANAASGKDSEAMEDAARDPVELRRTMHGAPLWARAATVAAGPVFNFIMSILVFGAIMFSQGEIRDPLTVGEVLTLPDGSYDLLPGDEILAINGVESPGFEDGAAWADFTDGVPQEPILEYTVRRDGQTETVDGPYLFPPHINMVAPRSAAYDADLRPDDVIVSVDGTPIFAFDQLKTFVEGSDGRALLLQVWRDGAVSDFALAPKRVDEPQADGGFVTHWRIGISGGMAFEPGNRSGWSGSGFGRWCASDAADHRRVIVGSVAHGDRRHQHLQPVGAHRNRRNLGGDGQPGGAEFRVVHRGSVHGRGIVEPVSDSRVGWRASGVLRI